jgi:hypothetical protein
MVVRNNKFKYSRSTRRRTSSDADTKLVAAAVIGAATGAATVGAYQALKPELWSKFFGESINAATKSIGYFLPNTGLWNSFAKAIVDNGDKLDVSEIIAQIPGALGTKIQTLCANAKTCEEIISPQTTGYLALIGVPLSVYLYVKFQGTKEEKEVLERKLREARRSTEETSDRRIKRRRTSKLRQLSEIEPSNFSQSSSDDKSSDDKSSDDKSSDDKSSDDKSNRKQKRRSSGKRKGRSSGKRKGRSRGKH